MTIEQPNYCFTSEEKKLIKELDTPARVQEYLNGLTYNWEPEGPTFRSFRRVVRDRIAHCIEGAVTAATILSQHGYHPRLLCMEARDIDHIVFPFRGEKGWGCVAQSRDPNLKGRDPIHRTLHDLVLSYHPYYWNYYTDDRKDLTLRGFAVSDLARCTKDWMTTEDDLWFIEDRTYELKYKALFPTPGQKTFLSRRDGGIDWIA